jgi:hypothetical protein
MPVMSIFLKNIWDKGISMGEILAIVIPLSIAFSIWLYKKYKYKNTFALRFPDVKDLYPPSPDGIYDKKKEIPKGEYHILIRVQPNRPLIIKTFNIRFVKSNYWKKNNSVVPDIISICDVYDNDIYDSATKRSKVRGVKLEKDNDCKGGYDVTYTGDYILSKNAPKFFTVVVRARQLWSGYISFRGKDKEGNLCLARSHFKVLSKKQYSKKYYDATNP